MPVTPVHSLVAIARNGWSRSIGTPGRNQSETVVAISRCAHEIEIGVLRSQCLDRRIDDKETIITEVSAWEKRRNAEGAQIQWMFTTEKAREKLRKAYPVKES